MPLPPLHVTNIYLSNVWSVGVEWTRFCSYQVVSISAMTSTDPDYKVDKARLELKTELVVFIVGPFGAVCCCRRRRDATSSLCDSSKLSICDVLLWLSFLFSLMTSHPAFTGFSDTFFLKVTHSLTLLSTE